MCLYIGCRLLPGPLLGKFVYMTLRFCLVSWCGVETVGAIFVLANLVGCVLNQLVVFFK